MKNFPGKMNGSKLSSHVIFTKRLSQPMTRPAAGMKNEEGRFNIANMLRAVQSSQPERDERETYLLEQHFPVMWQKSNGKIQLIIGK
jgi:hypothetical protein